MRNDLLRPRRPIRPGLPLLRDVTLAAALALIPVAALAAPAPWHLWASRVNASTTCAQTSPGPGWAWLSGPYRDVRCLRPLPADDRTGRPKLAPGQPEPIFPDRPPQRRLD